MSASIKDRSLPSNAFLGFPVGRFECHERRSLTIHRTDAGHWDVYAHEAEGGARVWAGRYETFTAASTIADGLNRVWVASPQSTPTEVLEFVAKRSDLLEIARGLVDEIDRCGVEVSPDLEELAREAVALNGGAS